MHDDLPARRAVTKRGRKLGAAVRVVRIRTTPTYVVLVLADASELWLRRTTDDTASFVQHYTVAKKPTRHDSPVHGVDVAELRRGESYGF